MGCGKKSVVQSEGTLPLCSECATESERNRRGVVYSPKTTTITKRAWSVSVYCRHEGAVLLVLHKRLQMWIPVGGEITEGETPLEAAQREVREETGFSDIVFPAIHKVQGAPPGLLLYEEHEAGDKGLHMNFAFIAEVPDKGVRSDGSYTGMLWVSSMADLPEPVPSNVLDALPYALTAGIR